jgi:hypothetical protein
MAERAHRIVITGAPMILHRQARKLVVLRVAFVVLRPIDQMDDVVDFVAGGGVQHFHVVVLAQILGSFASRPATARRICCMRLNWSVLARVRLEY